MPRPVGPEADRVFVVQPDKLHDHLQEERVDVQLRREDPELAQLDHEPAIEHQEGVRDPDHQEDLRHPLQPRQPVRADDQERGENIRDLPETHLQVAHPDPGHPLPLQEHKGNRRQPQDQEYIRIEVRQVRQDLQSLHPQLREERGHRACQEGYHRADPKAGRRNQAGV